MTAAEARAAILTTSAKSLSAIVRSVRWVTTYETHTEHILQAMQRDRGQYNHLMCSKAAGKLKQSGLRRCAWNSGCGTATASIADEVDSNYFYSLSPPSGQYKVTTHQQRKYQLYCTTSRQCRRYCFQCVESHSRGGLRVSMMRPKK